ncbi:MAG: hypothetical protein IJS66_02390 [Bacteroidales bacterium]|nr:hypothetical protein [Bacteroidales bacterium]
MKKNILKYLLFTPLLVLAVACTEKEAYVEDTASRVTLFPAPLTFTAEGNTPDGDAVFTAAVIVNNGPAVSNANWHAELVGAPAWVTLGETEIKTTYKESYRDVEHEVINKGIALKVNPNPGYRRSFKVNIVLPDGTAFPFEFAQLGEKADATIEIASKDIAKNGIEFIAAGGASTIEYTTNMDEASYSSDADWLSWDSAGVGSVNVTATKWSDKLAGRIAEFVITVGSDATSKATATVKVVQLAADDLYFIYGASVLGGTPVEQSIKLNKGEGNVHSGRIYFSAAEGGNIVMLNPESRDLSFPCFALAKDGTVAEIASESSPLPEGPEIDVDGLRSISVNMDAKLWNWNRVSTPNAMPDSEVPNYKTHEYLARDGSKKTWMIEWLRWDGGEIWPKLGSGQTVGLVNTATGGYAAADFPTTWDDMTKRNPAYETVESGLGTLEVSSENGRIYAFSELVTGTPTFGIGFARYEPLPQSWQRGSTLTDVLGYTYETEALKNNSFTNNPNADEEAHPMLRMQIQGICPYGWHIANASDWLDLAWAACKMSPGDSYPIDEADVNYKTFTGDGIPNMACWLKQAKYYNGSKDLIADGADEFDFNYYPLGIRYMTQGFTWQGTRAQTWVPLIYDADKGSGWYQAFRINVMIVNNAQDKAPMVNLDNGQAICPIRCVKNYIIK